MTQPADSVFIDSSVSVGDTAVAIGNGATANTANPFAVTPYSAQQSANAYAQGAAIRAQMDARAANATAQAEASKEYGKLWVVCGE